MKLSNMIRKTDFHSVATATPATPAAHSVNRSKSSSCSSSKLHKLKIDAECFSEQQDRQVWAKDDRITCDQCADMNDGQCLAAWRGEIEASRSYRPVRSIRRRCEGYAPGANDSDRRRGLERWSGLLME
jgi:hypothetical protein